MTPSQTRVLHVLPHVRQIGNGIVDVTVDLAIAQAEAGLPVAVAAEGGEYEELLAAHGITFRPLALTPGSTGRLRAIVREFAPTLVHTHTLKGLVLGRLAAPGVPVLNTAHRDLGRYAVAMRLAHRVIAVSGGIATILGRRVREDRVRVVRNGVLGGARRAVLLDVAAQPLSSPAVVYAGGMYAHKGVAVLLRAFAELVADGRDEGAMLYLVGEGPDRQEFQRLAAHLGIEHRVEWAGFRRDAVAWIRSADVFVLPSLQETFGLVLAEAREAGVAIVAAATGGVPEAVDDGRAGLLVAPGEVSELAAALHTLLSDDAERARLATAAAANTEWLTVGRMHREVLGVYDELLGSR